MICQVYESCDFEDFAHWNEISFLGRLDAKEGEPIKSTHPEGNEVKEQNGVAKL